MRVVVLARPGQLPVRAQEQRVGSGSAPQVQHDGSIRPRASPLLLSRPTCHSFFTGPFFLLGRGPRAFSGASVQVTAGENSFLHGFLSPDSYSPGHLHRWSGRIACFARFCMVFWHDMILLAFQWCCMVFLNLHVVGMILLDCAWHVHPPKPLKFFSFPVRLSCV